MNRVKGIAKSEKKFLFVDFLKGKDIYCYSGEKGYHWLTKEQHDEHYKKPITSPYIIIKRNNKEHRYMTLQDIYEEYTRNAPIFKKISNDKINLYKTGAYSKTAVKLFFDFNKCEEPEEITFDERDYIENCYNGALIYGEPYLGTAYKYDICSQYPSIMRNEHMQFPIKAGKWLTLTNEQMKDAKFYKYGIYRAKVTGKINAKLFRQNKKNFYTHIDLNRAIQLNYKIELIEDEKPNFLSYEGKLINGAKLFREVIDYLFQFKYQGYKDIKKIINALWGALCQSNKIKLFTDEIKENRTILKMLPDGDDIDACLNSKKYITLQPHERAYEYNYARIKPFLVAKGRYMISQIIEKNLNNCVRVHTDGILLKHKIKDVTLGNNIGELKYEGLSLDCQIYNSNIYDGHFYVDKNEFYVEQQERKNKRQQMQTVINRKWARFNHIQKCYYCNDDYQVEGSIYCASCAKYKGHIKCKCGLYYKESDGCTGCFLKQFGTKIIQV
jgi:hypothetical protein